MSLNVERGDLSHQAAVTGSVQISVHIAHSNGSSSSADCEVTAAARVSVLVTESAFCGAPLLSEPHTGSRESNIRCRHLLSRRLHNNCPCFSFTKAVS